VKHKKKPTENQEKMRLNFSFAPRYAKNALQNPDMLAAYLAKARQGLTPYIVAVTDYLRPPFIDQIDTTDYAGRPGDIISIAAGDDFEVASVVVKILSPAGVLIEQGACVEDLSADCWIYTTTVAVTDIEGLVISASAKDIPGHYGFLEITL
jgi:hypothetical protein